MTKPLVTVVDYGMGNILSVTRALEAVGADVCVSSKPDTIRQAQRLLLPGVGAFADGMAELTKRGLVAPIKDYVVTGGSFLGICLGMQMLFEVSEEFGEHRGLGLLPGRVQAIPALTADGKPHKIPHIGWNSLLQAPTARPWQGSILADLPPGANVYFVHSFAAVPADPHDRLADCDYDGIRLSAAVQRSNVAGCQFHPEKSGELGLKILRRFCFGPELKS